MNELLEYINSLSPDERDEFAARCKTSIGYLRKAISTNQKLGESLCVAIEQESGQKVTCEKLRPDLLAEWKYLRESGKRKAAA